MNKLTWRNFKGFLSLLLLSMIILLTGCGARQASGPEDDPTKTVKVDGTSISPITATQKTFNQQLLKLYPNLKPAMSKDPRPRLYVIPGLKTTKTLKMNAKSTVGISKKMDPQGLAITPKYVIISAYSRDKQYHSVLFLLSKKTGRYLKTIVLPRNSHVGGLAYDTKYHRLWVTTETTTQQASLSAYNLVTLKKANFARHHRATKFDQIVTLPQLKRASYATYYGGKILVGYFDQGGQGSLMAYPVNQHGLPDTTQAATTQLRGAHNYTTFTRLQGVSVTANRLLFSQSFGQQSSKLISFDNDGSKTWIDFDADDVVKSATLPPYMEQTAVDGDDIYILFESAAEKYRHVDLDFHADRVVKLDLKPLFK
ncbi:hypothetical protein [Lacticaseibacillus suibinensis]|uniref:hypothetical protein n=1 Tax=Lacticaseibacillus suibinensis TaxID=2486011 RepID=UPI000F7979F5|nr:hypothetical protein [Lacticaseibacillus suibinensis]